MMRITNLRKQHSQKEEMLHKKAEAEAELHALENKGDVENPSEAEKPSSTQENTSSEENPPS